MPDNRFLAALPAESRARLASHLRRVRLDAGTPVAWAGQPVEEVCFPSGAMLSAVAGDERGNTVEAGVVGREGGFGMVELASDGVSALSAVVQMPGEALVLPAAAFLQEYQRSEALQGLVSRFSLYLLAQVGQTALCNRAHSMDRRLARWLLLARDAARSDELPLRQEFLAMMLGVHRPGVTLAARCLAGQGAISYRRGNITVTDAKTLAAASCECYRITRERLDHLYLPGK